MNRTPTTLSPRDFASVLGVSESSVRRWIDGGRIEARRTAGGHRRIRVDDALRFIRENESEVKRGDLLGWTSDAEGGPSLESALLSGQTALARDLLLARFAAGADLAELCDELVEPAMRAVGELWKGGSAGVLVEHRATNSMIEALHRLRALAETPSSRVALGAAVPGDPYVLPSLMASTVLTAEGWAAHDLGANTPFAVFLDAIQSLRPELVWISVSYAAEPEALRDGVARLLERAGEGTFQLVIGGRDLHRLDLGEHPLLHTATGMRDLARTGSLQMSEAAAG